jgi:hypothetical protein
VRSCGQGRADRAAQARNAARERNRRRMTCGRGTCEKACEPKPQPASAGPSGAKGAPEAGGAENRKGGQTPKRDRPGSGSPGQRSAAAKRCREQEPHERRLRRPGSRTTVRDDGQQAQAGGCSRGCRLLSKVNQAKPNAEADAKASEDRRQAEPAKPRGSWRNALMQRRPSQCGRGVSSRWSSKAAKSQERRDQRPGNGPDQLQSSENL